MVSFLLFCTATIGMTSIIVNGVIFEPVQKWVENQSAAHTSLGWLNELIHCTQCTGFWCGLFCGILFVVPHFNWLTPLEWFCCGTAGAFLSPLGSNLIEWTYYSKMTSLRKLEMLDQATIQYEEMPEEVHENS